MTTLQSLLQRGELTPVAILRTLDHALLHPTLTDRQLRDEITALKAFEPATICIKPSGVALAAELLQGTSIGVGTVIGFPHGSSTPDVKARETERAFADGAREVDMVVNIGKVLGEDWDHARRDISAVLDVTRANQGVLKVIFETDYLTEDAHKIRLCELCSELRVDYVKTSTGFGFVKGADGRFSYQGATDHDLKLFRQHCSPDVKVKASAGMRTLADVLRAIGLGCERIGTTSTPAIHAAALRWAASGGKDIAGENPPAPSSNPGY